MSNGGNGQRRDFKKVRETSRCGPGQPECRRQEKHRRGPGFNGRVPCRRVTGSGTALGAAFIISMGRYSAILGDKMPTKGARPDLTQGLFPDIYHCGTETQSNAGHPGWLEALGSRLRAKTGTHRERCGDRQARTPTPQFLAGRAADAVFMTFITHEFNRGPWTSAVQGEK